MGLKEITYRLQKEALTRRGRARWTLAVVGLAAGVVITGLLVVGSEVLVGDDDASGWAWKVAAGVLTFGAGIAGNLWANALQKRLDFKPRDPNLALSNHDLAKLVGESIRVLLLLLVDSKPPPPGMKSDEFPQSVSKSAKKPLERMAAAATDFWLDRTRASTPAQLEPFDELLEPKLSRFIIDPGAKALDDAAWSRFLEALHVYAMNKTGKTDPPFANPADRRATVAMLGAQFGRSCREALKWDAANDGLGWAAMQLEIAGQLLRRTNASGPDAGAELQKAIVDLGKEYDEGFKAISAQVAALEAASQRRHRQTMTRLGQQHREVMRGLDDLKTQMAAGFEQNRIEHDKTQRKIDDLAAKLPQSATAPRAADNLAAAGAGPSASFVGRVEQLKELEELINVPDGPVAVAIVAGAGFGKTELAREFVNRHANAAPAGVDPAKLKPEDLKPDEWTGRWWLDGSKGGERTSLKKHFEAITGKPFPQEPRPEPGADLAALEREFLAGVRRDIGAACSTGRQLLVIDNAETPEQIRQYKPANRGRLISTTRRQPIPEATARTLPLDVMTAPDARDLLTRDRPDLRDAKSGRTLPAFEKDLDAIATHLGHHALALAYAGAALARPPLKTPAEILTRMRKADVGDEANLLEEFGPDSLGTEYKLGLAQSLGLLLDELADPASPAHDPLAIDLAGLASYCNPAAIPIWLLVDASAEPEARVEASLRALHERSIITLTTEVGMHRLTQSLVRARMRRQEADAGTMQRLLDALIGLYADTEWQPLFAARRTAMVAHVNACIEIAAPAFRPAPGGGTGLGDRAARLRADVAVHLQLIGALVEATAHIEGAITWAEAQTPCDERSLAIDYAWRASIRQNRGDLPGAEEDIARSITWAEAQAPRDERVLAIWYASRASIRQDRGDLPGAEEDIARSIAWEERQTPRNERELAIRYASRASIRQSRGDLPGAEEDIARSITWGEAQTPRDERSLAIRYASRASIRQDRGGLPGAEEDIARSITWGEAQTPCDERSLAILYASRASIRRSRRDLPGAEEDIARSITWGEAQTPRDERGLAIWHASRAHIRKDRGDLKGAEEDFDRSIRWCEAQTPVHTRGVVFLYESRARLRASLGQWPGAKADIDSSVRLHLELFGPDHEWTKITIRRQKAIHAGIVPG